MFDLTLICILRFLVTFKTSHVFLVDDLLVFDAQIEVERIIHVCWWILYIFRICIVILGDKAFRLCGVHGSSHSKYHSHRAILHMQVFHSVYKCGTAPIFYFFCEESSYI